MTRSLPAPAHDPPDHDELAALAAGFPAFRLSRTTAYDRTRYTAEARSLDTHPHTVVTADLAELAAALTTGQHPDRQP
jgi:hypothetical protein